MNGNAWELPVVALLWWVAAWWVLRFLWREWVGARRGCGCRGCPVRRVRQQLRP